VVAGCGAAERMGKQGAATGWGDAGVDGAAWWPGRVVDVAGSVGAAAMPGWMVRGVAEGRRCQGGSGGEMVLPGRKRGKM
jgi:hypothetical protein